MNVYKLKLYKTYYNQGFFNIPVDYDHFVRRDEGPIEIELAGSSRISGQVNRSANQNGTARIMGRVVLRDWFQSRFHEMDSVDGLYENVVELSPLVNNSRGQCGLLNWLLKDSIMFIERYEECAG
jgi:hypothetical protein